MKAIQRRQIGQRVDTNLLSAVFYGNQFPVNSPPEHYYDALEKFVQDDTMVSKIDTGVYEVGFEKEQLNMLSALMQNFDMEEFSKMRPHRIVIQKTGISRADSDVKEYGICPSSCVRIIMNYRKADARGHVGFAVRMGTDDSKLTPPGTLYTTLPFATVLQRNYSALQISSGKTLMNTRNRECASSFFVIADLYAPAMLLMKVVNNTAGVKPFDFDKIMAKPGVKGVVDKLMTSVDKGEMDMGTAMEMVKKIMSQKSDATQEEGVKVDLTEL